MVFTDELAAETMGRYQSRQIMTTRMSRESNRGTQNGGSTQLTRELYL